MEVDSKYESSKSSLSSSLSYPYTKLRMFRSLSNNFNRNIQYYGTNEHLKRVHPSSAGGGGGSKEVTNNNLNSGDDNNLISYEHLSESSSSSLIELVLPLTIFAITIIAVLFIAFILFVWIRKTFRENPGREFVSKKKQKQEKILEQLCRVKGGNSLVGTKRCEKVKNYNKLGNNKMNSRKWLRENTKQIVDNSAVVSDDIEQRKRETVEFKTTPPNSPKELQQDDDDDNDEEAIGGYESEPRPEIIHEMEKSNPFACPMTISDISVASIIQPRAACDSPAAQSSLALLHEELHCIQPKEEKVFKSIATSPPPFSPLIAQYHSLHHKYATTGTQTYFTKAPNSPNLLSSQFAVLQTPTTAGVASNPFILSPSDSNKENKEPTKLRNICLNKSITTSSSASSPSSVISTSPKVNTNVLQQQNSPLESPNNRFNFSPKILLSTPPASGSSRVIAGTTTSTGSSPISSTTATYKIGNYFRFPDIETPPVVAAISTRKHDDHQNVPSTLRKTFENLSIDESAAMASEKESIILKIDEVESPTPEEKSPTSVGCRRAGETGNNNNNNNYNINNNNYENTLTIRRARLKSISLDSDGARLVEENLTMPVEELVEIASSAYSNKQIRDSESESDVYSAAAQSCANNNNRFNPKNIYNLTINLDHRDSSLDICSSSVSDINMNQRDHDDDDDSGSEFIEDEICRTPTIKNFQQMKAVSLDSDQNQQHQTSSQSSKNMMHGVCKMASSETYSYYFGTGNAKNSISVPSTPKHLTSNKLKISSSEERSGTSTISGHGYSHRYSSSRKLGSFDENPDDANKLHVTSHVQQSSNSSKANLTASFQTLNVSSSNLKTLPEIMSINDFDQQTKPSGPSQRITPVPPQLMSSSKSGILQRRGSNHSLTLNLDGSCGNLMRGLSCSNYSLGNIHSSHLNIATTSGGSNYNLQGQQHHQQLQSRLKKNLLQRRGSNTSLTLNIQGSNNNLNRFNSHSSLNITGSTSTALQQQQRKGGLLERRNSNASLTLNIQNRGLSISNCNLRGSECSLSSVNTNQMNEIIMLEQEVEDAASHQTTKTHQRKFLSSENLHHIRSTAMSIGGCHRQQKDDPTPYGSVDKLACSQLENVPVISTKPLSPQSTSEDFKIYLANIQFLQSASNVLDEAQLKDLNTLFLKSYKNQSKDHSACGQKQFNNDDVLNNKIDPVSLVTFEAARKTESLDIQRELLVKLHQEFWNLPTNYQEKPMVFGSQSKNRYKSILPNEHSRVILQREDGAQQESYINANYIKGHDYASDCYIATQGPMQNTIFEFWLMVMQNNQGCQKIAMLTDFIESQRSKCAIYFPQDLNKCEVFTNTSATPDENFIRDNLDTIVDRNEKLEANFNYFVVKNEQIMAKNGYTIRKLLLIYGNSQAEVHQTFSIYHYWFPDWPDHRSPQDIDVLLDLSLDLLDGDCKKDFGVIDEEKRSRNEKNPLPIIHCSAGIGRTGCLAAILNGLGQIRANSSSNYGDGTSVDVLGIVCNLRLQRGGMVQNSEQYELIHRSLCLYYQKLSQKVLNL